MREALRQDCASLLGPGTHIISADPLSGGDTSAVYRIRYGDGDGDCCVAKVQPGHRARERSEREADGLRWLERFRTVRVPRVLGITPSGVLLLESIACVSRPTPATQTAFGEALAALHNSAATSFGYPRDNDIGTLAQRNTTAETWPAFFAAHRLRPMVEMCIQREILPPSTRQLLDQVQRRLAELCAPPEPPAPLHGDLWSGNVLWTPNGAALIDPAVYVGHREMDLAMMRLFGGFGPQVFDAYASCAPLAPGYQDRIELFQLYPVLVHAVMFDRDGGGAYAATVRRTLQRFA